MKQIGTAALLAALMTAAAAGAIVGKPTERMSQSGVPVALERMVPLQFGAWQRDLTVVDQIVDPQTQQLLDRLYSQILSRSYVDADGYRIMLSIAYGADQRPSYSHKPEVCYPSNGFKLLASQSGVLTTQFGQIPVTRLDTALSTRREPLTYWFTVGTTTVTSEINKRLVELGYGFSGRIPDGMLFRVSSIDPNPESAYAKQERFVRDLIAAIGPQERSRLAGLAPI